MYRHNYRTTCMHTHTKTCPHTFSYNMYAPYCLTVIINNMLHAYRTCTCIQMHRHACTIIPLIYVNLQYHVYISVRLYANVSVWRSLVYMSAYYCILALILQVHILEGKRSEGRRCLVTFSYLLGETPQLVGRGTSEFVRIHAATMLAESFSGHSTKPYHFGNRSQK